MTESARYLKELRRNLPFLHRRRILSEIRYHLVVATAAETAAGLDPVEAERIAVERLGPPDVLAERFRDDLSGRTIRVTTRQICAAGSVVVAMLAAALAAVVVLDVHRGTSVNRAASQPLATRIVGSVTAQYRIVPTVPRGATWIEVRSPLIRPAARVATLRPGGGTITIYIAGVAFAGRSRFLTPLPRVQVCQVFPRGSASPRVRVPHIVLRRSGSPPC